MSRENDLQAHGKQRERGLTLIELVVTILVLAVLLTLSAPSLTIFIRQNRLSGAANELLSELQLARSEANQRGQRVVLCPSASGSACDGAWGNATRLVFVDANRNGTPDTGEAVLKRGEPFDPSRLMIQTNDNNFSSGLALSPSGAIRDLATNARLGINASFNICDAQLASDPGRLLLVTPTGRFSVNRPQRTSCPGP